MFSTRRDGDSIIIGNHTAKGFIPAKWVRRKDYENVEIWESRVRSVMMALEQKRA